MAELRVKVRANVHPVSPFLDDVNRCLDKEVLSLISAILTEPVLG